jgi:hypothetical protein
MRELGSGARSSDPRPAVASRRALVAFQMAAAGSVVLGAWALARTVPAAAQADGRRDGVMVVDYGGGSSPARVADLLSALGDVPGLSAESLGTPGSLVGLGVRAQVLAQCGRCSRGGLPVPLWGAEVDHHAVAPGFFDLARIALLDGRAFDSRDGEGAPKVAVVNQTLAWTAFEKGQPIGRMIRVGWDPEAWYTVVGVVEDDMHSVPGAAAEPRGAVYLSALQNAPAVGSFLLRGSDDGVEGGLATLETAGLILSAPRALARVRQEAAASVRWVYRVTMTGAVLTLLLAVLGTASTVRQITRRQGPALAVRRALGASNRATMGLVLGGAARSAAWGAAGAIFGGSLVVALVRQAVGDAATVGPAGYLAVSSALVLAAVLAAIRSAREASAVEPSRALE